MEDITNKATKIVFLYFPCRVVVCESGENYGSTDLETNDIRVYERIDPRTKECVGLWITQFEFAGEIEWTKHAVMLTNEQRAQIVAHAAKLAKADEVRSNRAKALQEYQRSKYADKAAKYGEY